MVHWAVLVTLFIFIASLLCGSYLGRSWTGQASMSSELLQTLCFSADRKLHGIVQTQDNLARNISALEFMKQLITVNDDQIQGDKGNQSTARVSLKNKNLEVLPNLISSIGNYVTTIDTVMNTINNGNRDNRAKDEYLGLNKKLFIRGESSINVFMTQLKYLAIELIKQSDVVKVGNTILSSLSVLEKKAFENSASLSLQQSVDLMVQLSDLSSMAMLSCVAALDDHSLQQSPSPSSCSLPSVVNPIDVPATLDASETKKLNEELEYLRSKLASAYAADQRRDLLIEELQFNLTQFSAREKQYNSNVQNLSNERDRLQELLVDVQQEQINLSKTNEDLIVVQGELARSQELVRSLQSELTEERAKSTQYRENLELSARLRAESATDDHTQFLLEIENLGLQLQETKSQLAAASTKLVDYDKLRSENEQSVSTVVSLNEKLQQLDSVSAELAQCTETFHSLQSQIEDNSRELCESQESQLRELVLREEHLANEVAAMSSRLIDAEREQHHVMLSLTECEDNREHVSTGDERRCESTNAGNVDVINDQLKQCLDEAEAARVASGNLKYEFELLVDADQESRRMLEELESKLQFAEFNANAAIEEKANLEAERHEMHNAMEETNRLIEEIATKNDVCEGNLISLQRDMSIVQDRLASAADGSTSNCNCDLEQARSRPSASSDYVQPLPVRRTDFAARTMGASIVRHLTSPTYVPTNATLPAFVPKLFLGLFGLEGDSAVGTPEDAITDDMRVGSCWPLTGHSGTLVIRLAKPIVVDSISIEHLSRDEAVNPNTAPKEFEVYGRQSLSDKFRFLVKGKYTLVGESQQRLQYFPVGSSVESTPVQYIYVEISSNYGNPDYTCLYRVMVHGYLPQQGRQI